MCRQYFSFIRTSGKHTYIHARSAPIRISLLPGTHSFTHSLTLVTARSSALRSAFVHALLRLLLLLPASLLVPEVANVPLPPKVCAADVTESLSKEHPKRGRSLLGAYQYRQSAGAAAGTNESPRKKRECVVVVVSISWLDWVFRPFTTHTHTHTGCWE